MVNRRDFLRRVLAASAWGMGTPLAWQCVWPRPVFAADYPYPLEMRRVSNGAQLQQALDFSSPGSHVVLADGDYSGDFVLRGQAEPDLPIVVRAENPLGAKINGTLTLAGQNGIAHGLVLDNSQEFAAEMAGEGNRVIRSAFPGGRGIHVPRGANRYLIANNAFTGSPGPGEMPDHIFVEVTGEGSGLPEPGLIARNYFTDPDGGDAAEAHHIYMGRAHDDDANFVDLTIEENLIENSNRRRGIYCKRGCRIIRNKVLADRGRNGFRSGSNGELTDNVWQGKGGLVLNGEGHRITGNAWDNGMMVMCQSLSPGGNKYIAADQAELGDNIGDIELGFSAGSVQKNVNSVRIEDHSGEIIPMYHENTQMLGGQASGRALAESLTAADVGPEAPAKAYPATFSPSDPFAGYQPPSGEPSLPEVVPNSPLPASRPGGMREGPTPRASAGVKMHRPRQQDFGLNSLLGSGT